MNKYHSIMFLTLFSLSTEMIQTAAALRPRREMVNHHLQQFNMRLAGVDQSHTIPMTTALEQKLEEYEDIELMDPNLMAVVKNTVIIDHTKAQFNAKTPYWFSTHHTKILENKGHRMIIKKLIANEPLDTFFNQGIGNIINMYRNQMGW